MRADLSRSLLAAVVSAWTVIMLSLSGCNMGSGWTRNQIGHRYYSNGDYTAARRTFEQALLNDPWNADYAFNVAASMQRQGDLINAERMYEHALTLNPGHQPAYHAMAGLLHEQGRTAEAQEILTAWVETQPNVPEAHIEMASLQQKLGDFTAAEASLQTALRQNPRHPRALAQLGQVYETRGQPGEAATMYRRSLAFQRYQPQVASRLGAITSASAPSPALQLASQMPASDPYLTPFPRAAATTSPASPGAPVPFTTFYPGEGIEATMTAPLPMMQFSSQELVSTPTVDGGWQAVTQSGSTGGVPPATVPMQGTFVTPQMLVQSAPLPGGGFRGAPGHRHPITGVQPLPMNSLSVQAMPLPAGVSVSPSVGQPVEMGRPIPLSQMPGNHHQAVTSAMPVVPAF